MPAGPRWVAGEAAALARGAAAERGLAAVGLVPVAACRALVEACRGPALECLGPVVGCRDLAVRRVLARAELRAAAVAPACQPIVPRWEMSAADRDRVRQAWLHVRAAVMPRAPRWEALGGVPESTFQAQVTPRAPISVTRELRAPIVLRLATWEIVRAEFNCRVIALARGPALAGPAALVELAALAIGPASTIDLVVSAV